jgi:hypothetical protein
VNGCVANYMKAEELFWSGRRDLNSRPPAPKVNYKTLSSCLVYVLRASYITVYDGFRRLLFLNCSHSTASLGWKALLTHFQFL